LVISTFLERSISIPTQDIFNSEHNFELVVKRKNKRGLSIIVEAGTVIVSAPDFYYDDEIDYYINSKKDWILKQLDKEKGMPKFKDKNFINGEILKFLGKDIELNFIDGNQTKLLFSDGILNVKTKNKEKRRSAVEKWYKNSAKEIFTEKTASLCDELNLNVPEINVKKYNYVWGKCTRKTINNNYFYKIYFDWRVIQAPLDVIDYLVTHEVCHLIYFNHSKDFWKLVNEYSNDANNLRKWLDFNRFSLFWDRPV